MYSSYQSDCVFRTEDFQGPFSPSFEFKPMPEPEVNMNLEKFEDENGELDPIMEQKLEIIEKRPAGVRGKGKGKKKPKPKRLPGQRLLQKLKKQDQIEKSLERIVRELTL